jgi:haloacetate dehalogenase
MLNPTSQPTPDWFEAFESCRIPTRGAVLQVRHSPGPVGARPVLLLLHGFPQSHALWHRVAQRLQQDFYLVMPDLRGYGDSSKPPGLPDHSNYSKRAMAQDMVEVMDALGVGDFFLCGHDRGGRVAHRLALDHAQRVRRLCVLDIAPTLDMYGATDMAFARAYYHWFFLIQPHPLPETLIGGRPLAFLHAKLGGWGAQGLGFMEPVALAEYERCFDAPESIHGMCEDYRASAGIDLEHDRESRARGEKIGCDLLVLWGERGVVQRLFQPIALWQAQCQGQVQGQALPCGHYLAEELPQETAARLGRFFSAVD